MSTFGVVRAGGGVADGVVVVGDPVVRSTVLGEVELFQRKTPRTARGR